MIDASARSQKCLCEATAAEREMAGKFGRRTGSETDPLPAMEMVTPQETKTGLGEHGRWTLHAAVAITGRLDGLPGIHTDDVNNSNS